MSDKHPPQPVSENAPAPQGALTPGSVFAGRYQVVRCMAAGGMGSVYEVLHTETERKRALKVMHPHLFHSEEMRERFKREARIAAQIESEYIVDVSDAGVDEASKAPFLVMELLDGEELGHRLKRLKTFPPAEVALFIHQVAMALDKTHAKSIVHRDLKPENLFLTQREDGQPRVKILDFGVAKLVAEGATAAGATKSLGTPLYMAPEQYRVGSKLMPAADIYALGMTAYTLLTGEPYWGVEARSAGDVIAFAMTVVRGPSESAVRRAAARGVTLPPAFDSWFARVTAVNPEDRFPTASEAARGLASIFQIAPQGGRAYPSSPPAGPPPAGGYTQAMQASGGYPPPTPAPGGYAHASQAPGGYAQAPGYGSAPHPQGPYAQGPHAPPPMAQAPATAVQTHPPMAGYTGQPVGRQTNPPMGGHPGASGLAPMVGQAGSSGLAPMVGQAGSSGLVPMVGQAGSSGLVPMVGQPGATGPTPAMGGAGPSGMLPSVSASTGATVAPLATSPPPSRAPMIAVMAFLGVAVLGVGGYFGFRAMTGGAAGSGTAADGPSGQTATSASAPPPVATPEPTTAAQPTSSGTEPSVVPPTSSGTEPTPSATPTHAVPTSAVPVSVPNSKASAKPTAKPTAKPSAAPTQLIGRD